MAARPAARALARHRGWLGTGSTAPRSRGDELPGQAVDADEPLPQPQRLRHPVRDPLAVAAHDARAPALLEDRGHPHAVEAARNDPLERLQVAVDVHGQSVRGHAARDVDPDRADLASLGPDPGVALADLGPHPFLAE